MFIDSKLVLSDGQAVTDDAVSENVINFGAADLNIGQGNPLYIEVWLNTAFATSATLTLSIELEECATLGGTYTDKMILLPATKTNALLTPGQLVKVSLPENTKQFIRLNYEVSATLADGIIDAFITIN